MNSDDIPGLVFGGFLVIMAFFMFRAQRKAARNTVDDPSERRFLQNRIRRRKQVAGLLGLVGLMIVIGDPLMNINWKEAPATFAIYWLIVLAITLWIIVLAMGDMAATYSYSSIEMNLLKRQQRELEAAAERLRQQQSTERN